MTSKVLGLWQAALAAMQVLVGSAALADYVDAKTWGLLVAVVGALQAGTAVYTGKAATMPKDQA